MSELSESNGATPKGAGVYPEYTEGKESASKNQSKTQPEAKRKSRAQEFTLPALEYRSWGNQREPKGGIPLFQNKKKKSKNSEISLAKSTTFFSSVIPSGA